MVEQINTSTARQPWNKGRLIGPKPPLRPRHIWAIRTHFDLNRRVRDLAMFNCAIDSKPTFTASTRAYDIPVTALAILTSVSPPLNSTRLTTSAERSPRTSTGRMNRETSHRPPGP